MVKRVRGIAPALLCLISFFPAAPLLSAWTQQGVASWYGGIFQGRKTASGETYNTYAYTCAHKTLPFGTMLKVTNLSNNKSVTVRVNDRGPFVDNRIIDLTYAAAKDLDMIRQGTAEIRLEVLEGGIPEVEFTIQIGAWKNIENAARHRKNLSSAGLNVISRLGNDGITRIVMENVAENDVYALSRELKELGYSRLFIYQNRQTF